MSSRPSRDPSPSNSPKHTSSRAASAIPESSNQQSTATDYPNFAETPQPPAGEEFQPSNPLANEPEPQATSSPLPDPAAPVIIVTGSLESRNIPERAERSQSVPRQSRPLASRRRSGHSSSQPPRRSATPYSRLRSYSQPRAIVAMSSAASSPGNTSTSGTTSGASSGSNPAYHLPYAPFPYPMPGNVRGGQGNQGSGSGSGK